MTAHYSVEKRADLPVVIAEYFEDFGGDDDVNGVGEALHAVFDQLDHDAYIILDVRRATLSFNDMMLTTKRSFFIENPLSKHPRFLKTIDLLGRRGCQDCQDGHHHAWNGHPENQM